MPIDSIYASFLAFVLIGLIASSEARADARGSVFCWDLYARLGALSTKSTHAEELSLKEASLALAQFDLEGAIRLDPSLRGVERRFEHFRQWTAQASARVATESDQQVYHVIRARLFRAFASDSPNSNKTRILESVEHLGKLNDDISHLSHEVRDFYRSLISDPRFASSLEKLAKRAASHTLFHQTDSLLKELAEAYPILSRTPPDVAAKAMDQVAASRMSPSALHQWIAESSLDGLDEVVKTLPVQIKNDEARMDIAFVAVNFPHSGAQALLNRLGGLEWFASAPPVSQRHVFFALNYALHKAETSKVPEQQELLRNTVNRFLDGKAQLNTEILDAGISGCCDQGCAGQPSQISLQRSGFGTRAAYFDESMQWQAAATLAHEVSHDLSGQPVRSSVEYLIEEYRAWQVGYFAYHGQQLPMKAAARRAIELIYGKHYPSLVELQKHSPNLVYNEVLKKLGFRDPPKSREDAERQLQYISSTELAPKWGWDGYLLNRPGTKAR